MPRPVAVISDNAFLLLLATTLFWGGNAVAGKLAVGEVSPLLLTFCRWSLAALFLTVFGWRQIVEDWAIIRRHLLYIACMGGVGFALFNVFLYTALIHTTAINAAIVQAGIPMFIFMLSFLIFRTAVRPAEILGYSVTLIGVFLVAGAGDLSRLLALDVNRGDLIMVLAALAYALYAVALRSKPALHWASFLAMLFIAASITALPLALYEATTADFIPPSTPLAFGVLLYAAIFPAIVSQAMFIRGIELIGSNAAGMFVNLVPIFGAILAVLLLGERFQLYHALALALVLGGIFFAQRTRVV